MGLKMVLNHELGATARLQIATCVTLAAQMKTLLSATDTERYVGAEHLGATASWDALDLDLKDVKSGKGSSRISVPNTRWQINFIIKKILKIKKYLTKKLSEKRIFQNLKMIFKIVKF